MIEKVEGLEHHPHLLSNLVDVAFLIRNAHTVHPYITRSRSFKHIDATDERGLSRTGRSDDGNNVSFVNGYVHVR